MALLSIENLSVTYKSNGRQVKALDGFSLNIEEGESWGIVGESGSGKTTLIMALMRLIPSVRASVTGKALLNGKELISLSDEELRKIRWQEMALVFQKSMNAISPVHKVGTFIGDIYKIHCPNASKSEIRARIENLLELVNLPPRIYDLYPHELSGGMMQRVSIALSLLFDPKLLILDEATTALDVVTQTQILEEIVELEKKTGITRIMITHDMSVVASSCKNVAVLYAGRLLEAGRTEEVLVNPKHYYTKGLINSFPVFEDSDNNQHEPLKSIKGNLPDLSNPPSGCIFAPRCEFKGEKCDSVRPSMSKLDNGSIVYCHKAGGRTDE